MAKAQLILCFPREDDGSEEVWDNCMVSDSTSPGKVEETRLFRYGENGLHNIFIELEEVHERWCGMCQRPLADEFSVNYDQKWWFQR